MTGWYTPLGLGLAHPLWEILDLPLHTISRWVQYFPRSANPKGRQPIIWPNFSENYIKMKKIGLRGGALLKFYYIYTPLTIILSNFYEAL